MLLTEFDANRQAIINQRLKSPLKDFPKVVTFKRVTFAPPM